jgi:hypothetical protein
MTSDALTSVLLRRERILARIASQRTAIAESFQGLEGPISLVDRALSLGRTARAHPIAVFAIAAVFALRGRGLLGAAARGLSAWRLLRQIRGLAKHLGF